MTDPGELEPAESPAAAVERILSAVSPMSVPVARPPVARAVWLCACMTLDEAPTWLVYETADGDIGWCRMPDRADVADVVDARIVTGGHLDPVEVLRWLRDLDARSAFGDGSADPVVLHDLGRKIRETTTRGC